MKIKNIGAKIIGIGGKVIMPGTEVEIEDKFAKESAVIVMRDLGFITYDDPKPKKVEKAEPVAEEVTDEAPKKRTRGKKASE